MGHSLPQILGNDPPWHNAYNTGLACKARPQVNEENGAGTRPLLFDLFRLNHEWS